jgi:hypothetical protein
MKNKSLNFNIKSNNHNHRRMKTINNYKSRENNEQMKYIHKMKKIDVNGIHKIIKKRVVLEEEYMISPEGEKKLLSVKRLDNGNYNYIYDKINNERIMNKNLKKEKTNIKVNKLNSHKNFYSSLFKDNIRKNEYNRVYLNLKEEDSQTISNIEFLKNNKANNAMHQFDEEKTQFISKSITANPSHLKNKNNKNINKTAKNLDLANNLKILHEQKINSKDNKEKNLKKKLFYNKIFLLNDKSINKFNKSNNNFSKKSRISSHTNFLNSNRASMNYLDDKEKSKMDTSRGIYERISFLKDQPYMVYHSKEQNPFVINNNQNCPNFVNIVFYNHHEQNKKNSKCRCGNHNNKMKESCKYPNYYNIIDIPQQKISCRLKRSNYRFHEVKSMSIDNPSFQRSTRNYHQNENNNIIRISYNNSYYNLNKDNNTDLVYSSMDNMNNYYDLSEYIPSRDVNKTNSNKDIFNKRGYLIMSEDSRYSLKSGHLRKTMK